MCTDGYCDGLAIPSRGEKKYQYKQGNSLCIHSSPKSGNKRRVSMQGFCIYRRLYFDKCLIQSSLLIWWFLYSKWNWWYRLAGFFFWLTGKQSAHYCIYSTWISSTLVVFLVITICQYTLILLIARTWQYWTQKLHIIIMAWHFLPTDYRISITITMIYLFVLVGEQKNWQWQLFTLLVSNLMLVWSPFFACHASHTWQNVAVFDHMYVHQNWHIQCCSMLQSWVNCTSWNKVAINYRIKHNRLTIFLL